MQIYRMMIFAELGTWMSLHTRQIMLILMDSEEIVCFERCLP